MPLLLSDGDVAGVGQLECVSLERQMPIEACLCVPDTPAMFGSLPGVCARTHEANSRYLG
jgi:hypothetical protein